MPRKRGPKWLRKWKKAEAKAKLDWDAYAGRDRLLKEMGFATYSDYLASPTWLGIRLARLLQQRTCSCCASPAIAVHHELYTRKVLAGDEKATMKFLHPLCTSCHRRVEFVGERKRSHGEAVRQLHRMIFKFKNGMTKGQMIRKKQEEKKAKRLARKQKRKPE